MNIVQKVLAQPRNFLPKMQVIRAVTSWLIFTIISFVAWLIIYEEFPPVSEYDFLVSTFMGYVLTGYSYSEWLKDFSKDEEAATYPLPVFLFVNVLTVCFLFVAVYLLRFYCLFFLD